jgi:hypothetical protein
MVKVVSLFLIAILALGMFGKLRVPKIRKGPRKARKCKSCGNYLIGDAPCQCKKSSR